jgi:hypothetical protein
MIVEPNFRWKNGTLKMMFLIVGWLSSVQYGCHQESNKIEVNGMASSASHHSKFQGRG